MALEYDKVFYYKQAKYRIDIKLFKDADDKNPSVRIYEADDEKELRREYESFGRIHFKEHKENSAIKSLEGVKRFMDSGRGPRFSLHNNDTFHGLVLDVKNHSIYKEKRINLDYIKENFADYTYIAYTSFDHMIDGIERFHIIFPFSNGLDTSDCRGVRHRLLERYQLLNINTCNDALNPKKTWILPQRPVFASDNQPIVIRNYGAFISSETSFSEEIIPRNLCVAATVFQDNNSISDEKVKQNFNLDGELIFNSSLTFLLDRELYELSRRFVKILSHPLMHYAALTESERLEVIRDLKKSKVSFELYYYWRRRDAGPGIHLYELMKEWELLDDKNDKKGLKTFLIAKSKGVPINTGVGGCNIDDAPWFNEELCDRAPVPVKILFDYFYRHSLSRHKAASLAGALSLLGYFYHGRILSETNLASNTYIALVAGSGLGKGSIVSSINHLCSLYFKVNERPINQPPASSIGLFDTLRQFGSSVYFVIDEFGSRVLGKVTARNIPSYLDDISGHFNDLYSHSTKEYPYYRGLKGATSEDFELLPRPYVSVFGATQPNSFLRAYTTHIGSDGFLGRFITFFPNPKTVTRPSITNSLRERKVDKDLHGFLSRILTMPKSSEPAVIPFESQEARSFFESKRDEYATIAGEWGNLKQQIQESIYNRIAENGLKIALIAHENGVISLETLKWAIEVAECSAVNVINHLFDGASMPSSTDDEQELRGLYEFISKANRENRGRPIALSDVTKRYRKLDANTRDRYLEELILMGRILREETDAGKTLLLAI